MFASLLITVILLVSERHKKFQPDLPEQKRSFNFPKKQYRHASNPTIASENAAEPQEIAHAPEGASETTSIDSSRSFSNASSPVDESVVLRDTASILQELALQRLSGSSPSNISRRSFDSEIGREIVRERKMRQELESARAHKSEDLGQHLPPCLRARHARTTRAALSRSLDEAKYLSLPRVTVI